MPTILRIDGFAVRIYPNDHQPPHVHVIGANGEAVVSLDGSSALIHTAGLSRKEVSAACEIVATHIQELVEAWEAIHGN